MILTFKRDILMNRILMGHFSLHSNNYDKVFHQIKSQSVSEVFLWLFRWNKTKMYEAQFFSVKSKYLIRNIALQLACNFVTLWHIANKVCKSWHLIVSTRMSHLIKAILEEESLRNMRRALLEYTNRMGALTQC